MSAAFLVGTVIAAVTPEVAHAQGRATHYATHTLAWNPNPSMPVLCMPARAIAINAGTYTWGAFFGGVESDLTSIDLIAEDYFWGNCLYPKDGYYLLVSSLDPDDPFLQTAYARATVVMSAPDRAATWGTYLDS
ncbi:hypothetical protein [Saccharothrix sp. Mg75]|uniref:hypothetical protein n=1 Tax=Saccharothrix sp. Mg75 TaxID=3445357 RepID=UPI003EEC39C1